MTDEKPEAWLAEPPTESEKAELLHFVRGAEGTGDAAKIMRRVFWQLELARKEPPRDLTKFAEHLAAFFADKDDVEDWDGAVARIKREVEVYTRASEPGGVTIDEVLAERNGLNFALEAMTKRAENAESKVRLNVDYSAKCAELEKERDGLVIKVSACEQAAGEIIGERDAMREALAEVKRCLTEEHGMLTGAKALAAAERMLEK